VVKIHTLARAAEKIAVSVDRRVLAQAERLRKATGESRSALVSRALRALLASERAAARVAEYIEAYQRIPERPAEIRTARALSRRSLAALDWEES
jgi:metal-responsive CopG/Arc/MetJ family transcriptional regulator